MTDSAGPIHLSGNWTVAGRLYITSTDSSSTIAPQVTLTSDVAVYTFNSVGVISTAGANQLAADRDAVLAQVAHLQRPADGGPATLLGQVGTLNTTAIATTAASGQLVTDTAAVTAAASKILKTNTILGVAGLATRGPIGPILENI